MASKATIERQKSAEKVIAAGRTHKSKISQEIAKAYGRRVGAAVDLLIETIVNDLQIKTTEMLDKDDAHEAELRDDPTVRQNRDDLSAQVYDQLVNTREQLEVVCGSDYVARLGFGGKTPDDPIEVARLAKVTADNLSSLPPPPSKLPGYTFDPAVWSAPLVEKSDQLTQLVTQVATEEREAEATLMAKHETLENYDAAFSCTANIISALLQSAGEKELADRVRPSTHRSGQTRELTEEPAQAASQH